MMTNLTPELIEKAKAAQTPEELQALAKENGWEMTEESAQAYFEQLNKSGELSDEELSNVSGGGCHKGDRLVVTHLHSCNDWVCKRCNHGVQYKTQWVYHSDGKKHAYDGWTHEHYGVYCDVDKWYCKNCRYMVYEGGLWLCNKPK
ncbi:MAG: Nif11-like leader peptide family RiPP precursor [Oscillospiraceae bacterium]|nr:Nif11-like leader peptide family RiPP precursor [Oscillospiraceae bacterium]